MYQVFLDGIKNSGRWMEFLAGESVWACAAVILTLLSVMLLLLYCGVRNYTVRLYNWNGKRYCYLGRLRLRHRGGGYLVRIGERMADRSYTTLYQLCPPRRFVRRNRYQDMVLCAGSARCLLQVDSCMRQSVYYRA